MNTLPKELIDGCDVVYEISKSGSGKWYAIGYLGSASPNDGRPITSRGEIGSNATMTLVDESQKGLSISRLNVARINGTAPHNKNLPALILWVLTSGTKDYKILIDTDHAEFNMSFDLRKTYYKVGREVNGQESAQVVAKVTYEGCKVTGHSLAAGAASKYTEDMMSVTWEETINHNITQ